MKLNLNDDLTLDCNKPINLIIIFPHNYNKYSFLSKEKIYFYKNQTLSKGLRLFFLSRSEPSLKGDYFYYLSRNKKVIKKLSKEKQISELNLNELDMIIISYKELKTEEDSNNLDITYNSNKDNRTINYLNPENEIENKNSTQRIIFNANKNISRLNIIRNNISKIKNNSQTKKIIFIIIGIILILLIIGIIIYIKTRKTTKEKITYLNEDLIIKKNYPVNRLFRYSSIQKNEIKIEGKDISANNNSFETSQLIDFIFIVREKNIEIEQTSKTKKTQKEWYTGYIGFLNITIVNETHNMLSLYDKSLFENINTKNLI